MNQSMKKTMPKGRSNPHRKFRQPSFRSQLQTWSRAVRERDGNRCVICGNDKHT